MKLVNVCSRIIVLYNDFGYSTLAKQYIICSSVVTVDYGYVLLCRWGTFISDLQKTYAAIGCITVSVAMSGKDI
jgi:hypothetical protein